jgi:hypothetical protein
VDDATAAPLLPASSHATGGWSGWASAASVGTPASRRLSRTTLFPLLWLGVITGEDLLVLEHLVMFPLMYLVMRRRRAEYGDSSHTPTRQRWAR